MYDDKSQFIAIYPIDFSFDVNPCLILFTHYIIWLYFFIPALKQQK